ncbi:MAG: gluconokinase [Chloracidobacterium sp.]|nr:gluconokinase [Chloracidobacterium sp.]
MEKSLILALDIGTSSVRASIFNDAAEPLRGMSVKIERTLDTTDDGGSEIDADEAFAQVVAAIDALLEKSEKLKGEITHVAACSFWHSLMGIDAKGKPTTKVLGWADTRSREYSGVLKKSFDESETHNRTGAHFHSSFWPAKLLWFKNERSDVFEKTAKWLSFSDYVALKLFGTATTSISMGSGTGIFDIRKCKWDAKLLKALKISPDNLPEISETDSTTFKLNKTFAKRWPQLAHAKWSLAIGDGAADHIGSCGFGKSGASLMVGTSAAMRVAFRGKPPAKIPDGLWCYRVDRERVIIGGALSDGGNLYSLIKQRFHLPSNVDKLLLSREAPDDLVVIPFFFGERSTGYDENARGAIIGLTATHDGIDVLLAAMEGVAFRLDDIYQRLKKVVKITDIVASGGALRDSPVWTDIIASVLGEKLLVNDTPEASSRGAVLLALETTGKM